MRNKCKNCGVIYDATIKGAIKKYCSKRCGRQDYYKNNKIKEKENCSKWYQKNRNSELESNKEYRKQKRELFDWYHNKDRFNGMREIILLRDNNSCRACLSKIKIVIHHKDGTGISRGKNEGLKTNNDINNLICLCSSCHTTLHHWQKRNNTILDEDEGIIKILNELK